MGARRCWHRRSTRSRASRSCSPAGAGWLTRCRCSPFSGGWCGASVCQSKQIGGIITAMLKFSHQKVGLPVSYIQLAQIGVSISSSADARVSCTVFHDADDGSEFGALLSRELLAAFIQTFQHELQNSSAQNSSAAVSSIAAAAAAAQSGGGAGIFAMDNFLEFQSKISDIIRNAVKPLLDQRQLKVHALALATNAKRGMRATPLWHNSHSRFSFCRPPRLSSPLCSSRAARHRPGPPVQLI